MPYKGSYYETLAGPVIFLMLLVTTTNQDFYLTFSVLKCPFRKRSGQHALAKLSS